VWGTCSYFPSNLVYPFTLRVTGIKRDLLYFKVLSNKIYTLLDALKLIVESLFPRPLRHLQKWFLNASTDFSADENCWLRIFLLMCKNKKNSLGAKLGLYGRWPINSTFWPVKKALVLADVCELLLSWCTGNCLLLFVYRISPKTSGRANPSRSPDPGERHCGFQCQNIRRPLRLRRPYRRGSKLPEGRASGDTEWHTGECFYVHTHALFIGKNP